MSRLDEKIGSVGFDNLINGTYPPAEVFNIRVAGGQGVLERGTLLALDNEYYRMIGTETTGKANAVLAEPVDTNIEYAAAVPALAYRTGHFNTNKLIVADGYRITEADKEALRVAGILISYAVEI